MRALVSALAGHLTAATLVFGIPWRPFDSWTTYLGIELSLAATIASLLWADGSRPTPLVPLFGVLILAFCVALGGISGGAISLFAGLLAWALLPAVAGLSAARRDESA